MGYSKKWLELSPEERKIKRKEYNLRYQNKHPERVKESDRKYKEKNKDKIRETATEWQRKKGLINKLKAIKYKGGKCMDCGGEFESCCYDFHHLDPNEKDFSFSQISGRTFDKIIPEIDKCILLCSHCHKLRHFYEKWSPEEVEEIRKYIDEN